MPGESAGSDIFTAFARGRHMQLGEPPSNLLGVNSDTFCGRLLLRSRGNCKVSATDPMLGSKESTPLQSAV